MKWATEKQITFAELINAVTGVPLPDVQTKLNYQIYISDNVGRYNEIIEEKRKHRFSNGHYSSMIVNVHGRKERKNTAWCPDEEQDSEWAAVMDFSWM